MISHKHRCIFIHTPKAAGTSLIKGLGLAKLKKYPKKNIKKMKALSWHKLYPASPHHLTGRQIKEMVLPSTWLDYFKFAFVRNPWEQRVSHFVSHQQGNDKQKRNAQKGFGNFLLNYGIEIKIPYFSQLDYITTSEGGIMVDFIGRFENLQEDYDVICDKIGISRRKIPHRNKSKHKHYTEYYDDETREIVAQKYKKDIEYFGYEFGE